jgi:hypothetical protein
MTEQAPDRVLSGIDISKTIAGALAAVCAAVIGSFLGVAGTLVGAAVASIIGSVGTELWARSIRRGHAKLQATVAPAFVKAPAAVGTPEVAAAGEDELPSHTVPEAPPKQIRWKRVWLLAGAVFVLAMGALTVFEVISGESVASAVGNSTGAKSTFGGILNPGTSATTPAVTTTPTPTATPTTGSDTTSTEAPATTAPTSPVDTGSGTGTGDSATTEPTTAATTEAPVQSPPAAGQGQDQGQGGGSSPQ